MANFRYNPAPKSGGGFTTRVVLGEQIAQSAITAKAALDAGITPAQAELCIQSVLDQFLAAAAGGQWSDSLYERISFRPTSGGSSPTPEGFETPVDINAAVAISFRAESIDAWRETLMLESMGGVGKVTPVVDTTINQANGHEDEYTVGNLLKVIGSNLRFDKADTGQGLWFIKADNSEVRATIYSDIEPGSFTVLVPTGLTGTLRIRVTAYINGSLRSFTYTNDLTASV